METISSRVRRCSFCRCPNHNILACDHSLLIEFQDNLFQKKSEILGIRDSTLYEKIALFESWILYQCMFGNSFILKAYGVRYLGCRMRDRITTFIPKISSFIWEFELNPENQINPNLPSEMEEGLDWYFDRTGDPNLLSRIFENKINILIEELNPSIDFTLKEECSICYESKDKNQFVKINCSHEFCGICVKKIINSNIKKCAFCRLKIDEIKVKNSEMENLFKIN